MIRKSVNKWNQISATAAGRDVHTVNRTNRSYQTVFYVCKIIKLERKRFSKEEIKGMIRRVSLLKRNCIQRMQRWTAFDQKSNILNCSRKEREERRGIDNFVDLVLEWILREIASDGFYFLSELKDENLAQIKSEEVWTRRLKKVYLAAWEHEPKREALWKSWVLLRTCLKCVIWNNWGQLSSYLLRYRSGKSKWLLVFKLF